MSHSRYTTRSSRVADPVERKKRDAAIYLLSLAGASNADIASAFELTFPTVAMIVKREGYKVRRAVLRLQAEAGRKQAGTDGVRRLMNAHAIPPVGDRWAHLSTFPLDLAGRRGRRNQLP